uniref:dihydroxyacetone kinase subunit DhaK n=1 Tax=Acidocella sp. C78 TaxID=1671486 RepID=UPI0020C0FE6F
GTPLVELYILYRKAEEIARSHGLTVARSLVGPYMTSLEMAGTSITLLRLTDDMIRHWDAPVVTRRCAGAPEAGRGDCAWPTSSTFRSSPPGSAAPPPRSRRSRATSPISMPRSAMAITAPTSPAVSRR